MRRLFLLETGEFLGLEHRQFFVSDSGDDFFVPESMFIDSDDTQLLFCIDCHFEGTGCYPSLNQLIDSDKLTPKTLKIATDLREFLKKKLDKEK